MKYLSMLKNEETYHPDPLQKPQKDLFAVNAVPHSKGFPENKDPEAMDYDAEITTVIHEFDEAGIIVPEVPVEIRREALALEDEITEACNAGDVPRFREALHAWRAAWMRSLH